MPQPIVSAADLDHADLSGRPLLSVPLWKVALLSATTWGTYQYVWFFRQWRRQESIEDCSPIMRTIFAPLFYYSLGRAVRNRQLGAGLRPTATAGILAICFLAFKVVWRAPVPYALGGLLSFLPLLVTQREINRLNEELGSPEPSDRFGWPAVIAVAVGGLFSALVLIGLLLPAAP